MRPAVLTAALLFLTLFGACWAACFWTGKHTQDRRLAEFYEPLYRANLALDKVVYGDNSLFQSREETALALFAYMKGDAESSGRLLQSALTRRRALGGPQYNAAVYRSLRHQTNYYAYTGQAREGESAAKEALVTALNLHKREGTEVSDCFIDLAECEQSLGKFADAEHYLQCANDWNRVQVLAAELRDNVDEARRYRAQQAVALMHLAAFYSDFGKMTDAASYADKARELFSKSSETISEGSPLKAIRVATSRKDYDEAERILSEYGEKANSEHARWRGMLATAQLYYKKGEYGKATALIEQLENALRSSALPDTPDITEAVDLLHAQVDAKQGRYEPARKRIEELMPRLQNRIPNGVRTKLAKQTLVAIINHDPLGISDALPTSELAASAAERTRRLHGKIADIQPAISTGFVGVSSATIEPLEKVDLYRDLVDHFQHNCQYAKSRVELANAKVDLADALSSADQESEAIPVYKEAIDIFESEKSFPARYLRAVSQYAMSKKQDEQTITLMDKARPKVKIVSSSDRLALADFWLTRSELNDCESIKDRAKYVKQAFEIRRQELGLDNVSTASAMMRLGAWTAGAQGRALQKRASTVLSDKYVSAVIDHGPLSREASDAFSDCAKLHVQGFTAEYPYQLAAQKLIYGDDDGATAKALLEEAANLSDSDAPPPNQQPFVLVLGLILMFVCGFGELYIFVQSQDAKNSERPPFTLHRRWLMAKTAMSLACGGLLGWGAIQIFSITSDDDWKQKKQYANASKAVAALRKRVPNSAEMARASLQLAEYCNDEQKAKKKECLLTATKIFETSMHERATDATTFGHAYKDLAEILRDEDREEEAKALEDKAFQLSRAGDTTDATVDRTPEK